MTYRIFLPSDSLIKTAQSTLQALAIIGSLTAIFVALAGAGYVLIWLCGVLVAFIQAFSSVCRAVYDAVGGRPAAMAMTLITVAMILFIIKLGCLLFPLSFTVQGVRV